MGVKLKMQNNQVFIDALSELVQLISIQQNHITDQKTLTSNEFRIKALAHVIKTIQKHGAPITSPDDIKHYPRIGKGTLEKIKEILETGTLAEIKELRKKYQKFQKEEEVINELIEVVGIGKNTALDLIHKYKVESLDDLKRRFEKGEIELNEKIQIGLKYVGKFEGKIPRKEIDDIYKYIQDTLSKFDNLTVTICGSYRRGLPTSNDIDVLLCDLDMLFMDQVKRSSLLKDVVAVLKKKKFIVDDIAGDDITTKYMGFCKWKKSPFRRIDIRLVPVESFYTATAYFTGSYELNKIMRQKAKKMGLKLNEYGLYDGDVAIDIGSEEALFAKLDMGYLAPEERSV